jgi:peptide-methionine (S)-S-oxide reductase
MKLTRLCLMPAMLAGLMTSAVPAAADENARVLPVPAVDEPRAPPGGTETAVLSGGCFWGMQGVFEHLNGVRQVVAGYAGGAGNAAQYETVSTGKTGHAESVKIVFDPAVLSYGEILRVYFSVAHDPTELDRQGPDSGSQYRSDIFFTNGAQERIARAYMAQLARAHEFDAPIVTRMDRLSGFYPAEAYHQDYLIHNPDSLYIVINDLPKIANLKRLYPALYRESPVRLANAH